jgi:hypothetical protein
MREKERSPRLTAVWVRWDFEGPGGLRLHVPD